MWVSATWLVYGLFCCFFIIYEIGCSWDSHITFGVSSVSGSVWHSLSKFEFAQSLFRLTMPQCPFNTFQSICISFINSTPHILKPHGDVEPVQDTEELLAVRGQAHDHGPAIEGTIGKRSPSSAPSFLACVPHWGCKFSLLPNRHPWLRGHSSCPLSLDDACQRCGCFLDDKQ